MKIRDIIEHLELFAPAAYQESYDNCGLLVGSPEHELKGVLVTLDCTEEIIIEAEQNGCNLIVAHHPLIFKALKKINNTSYVERTIVRAIKTDIAIFAIHTNLDNVLNGVNGKIADKLSLSKRQVILPKENAVMKAIVYVPETHLDEVTKAIHIAGGGAIGNYTECSFHTKGTGRFRPDAGANPTIGQAGQLEEVSEYKVEIIFSSPFINQIISAIRQSHPYEEPAYDIISLENKMPTIGSGLIGQLEEEMNEKEFLVFLKAKLGLSLIRHTSLSGRKIKKVALCGGSGSFLLGHAIQQKADVFISSDFKYHEFFDADSKILIADINHYEAEVSTKELIYEIIRKKFSNIALVLSNVKTNPISYL